MCSFGFTGSFLPLCESSEVHIDHQEFEHRQHKTHRSVDDHHLISHKEHFDEDFFDLILCYLTESNHLSGSVKVEYPSPKKIQEISTPLLALLFSFSPEITTLLQHTLAKEYYYKQNNYSPPDPFNYQLRGPPQIV